MKKNAYKLTCSSKAPVVIRLPCSVRNMVSLTLVAPSLHTIIMQKSKRHVTWTVECIDVFQVISNPSVLSKFYVVLILLNCETFAVEK